MISNRALFFTLVGIVPLLAGCWPCICKKQLSSTETQRHNITHSEKPIVEFVHPAPRPTPGPTPIPTPAPLAKIALGHEIKSEEEFKQLIKNPTVVFFDAEWCSACDQMDPIFDKVSQEFSEKYQFVRINVDKFRALATNTYNLNAIPAILFFNNGKEINTADRIISSNITKEDFVKKVKRVFGSI